MFFHDMWSTKVVCIMNIVITIITIIIITILILIMIILYIYMCVYPIGGLEHDFNFSKYWECHHPNWWTHIFQRGRYTTNQSWYIPMNHHKTIVFFHFCFGAFQTWLSYKFTYKLLKWTYNHVICTYNWAMSNLSHV